MSGGRFNYKQYEIKHICDQIEHVLEVQGKEIPKHNQWHSEDFLKEYPEERYYTTYPPEIQKIFKDGIKHLKLAHIYAQRIDWFLSGDDGEESLVERLNDELNELNNEKND